MAATAQDIIDSVRRLISDETSSAISGYRWSDTELLAWITEAQRAVVNLKPEAFPVTATHTVTAGARQQINPLTAYKLIRVEQNVSGKAITLVERDVLDTFLPGWMQAVAAPPTAGYEHYILDANDSLAFYLFSFPQVGHDVVVTYAGIPAAVTDVGDDLALDDMYNDVVTDYTVYRALSKDARGAQTVVADKYRDKFLLALGATRQVLKMLGANAQRPPDAEA